MFLWLWLPHYKQCNMIINLRSMDWQDFWVSAFHLTDFSRPTVFPYVFHLYLISWTIGCFTKQKKIKSSLLPCLLGIGVFWERNENVGDCPGSPHPLSLTTSTSLPSTLWLSRQSGLYFHQWALGVWAPRVRAMSGCYLISTDLEKLVITIEQQFRRVCNQQETKPRRRKNEWDMWDKLMYFFPPMTRCWKCVPGYHSQHSWGELLGI